MGALGRAISQPIERRSPRNIDWWLIAGSTALLAIGLLAQYSLDLGKPASQMFESQVARVLIGAVPFFIFFRVGPSFWQRVAPALYGLNIILLAAVLFVGSKGGGAVRWIQIGPLEFQPSEMSKLFLALTLAAFFASRRDRIRHFSTFRLSFLHVLVPAALVFAQPHLGAAVVLI